MRQQNSVCKCEDVWGYHGSWLYLYQLEARRRDLMHINWSPQAGVLRESCQISHLDFIRPLNWTGSKTDKLDLLLTGAALSFTQNPVSIIILSANRKCNQYIPLLQILMNDSLTFSQSWQMLNVDGWIFSSLLKCAIDCRHLNERIKVIAQRSVACVGNGCRRIIRHEYSTRGFEASNRSPVFTGQSSSNGWMATGPRKSVIEICREIRRIEIGRKIRQETWHRRLCQVKFEGHSKEKQALTD